MKQIQKKIQSRNKNKSKIDYYGIESDAISWSNDDDEKEI